MSKRFIITESEKKDIKSKYNIQETWLDDVITNIKSAGKNVVDFFTGAAPDKEIDSVDDVVSLFGDASNKVKEKLKAKSQELKKKSEKPVDKEKEKESLKLTPGTSVIRPMQLYKKLNFELQNPGLSAALVANAYGESNFKCDSFGDGGGYASDKKNALLVNGQKYCSFGLWGYNICVGLGIKLLQYYGKENASDAEKLEILKDCDKQIDFMANYIKQKTAGMEQKNAVEWVAWIVQEVERPKNKYGAIVKRGNYLVNNIKDIVPESDLENMV
jgi:hypothetical protein